MKKLIALYCVSSLFSASAWADSAMRIFCENRNANANQLTTLRSDVVTSYIAPEIVVTTNNGVRLDNLQHLQVLYSDGLKAQLLLVANTPRRGLYHVEVSIPFKKGLAQLIAPTEIENQKPYALIGSELWVQRDRKTLEVFSTEGLQPLNIIKSQNDIHSIHTMNDGLLVMEQSASQLNAKLWIDAKTSRANLAYPKLASTSKVEAQQLADSFYFLVAKNNNSGWQLFRGTTLIFESTSAKMPFLFELNTEKFALEVLESYPQGTFAGGLKLTNLTNKNTQTHPYTENLLRQASSITPTSEGILTAFALDKANQKILFSAGFLGGVVSFDLTNKNFILHSTKDKLCFRPSAIQELPLW
ncbi:MAG: hypothetical protein ACLGGX_11305 [Bdellovibrionia bacterium]